MVSTPPTCPCGRRTRPEVQQLVTAFHAAEAEPGDGRARLSAHRAFRARSPARARLVTCRCPRTRPARAVAVGSSGAAKWAETGTTSATAATPAAAASSPRRRPAGGLLRAPGPQAGRRGVDPDDAARDVDPGRLAGPARARPSGRPSAGGRRGRGDGADGRVVDPSTAKGAVRIRPA